MVEAVVAVLPDKPTTLKARFKTSMFGTSQSSYENLGQLEYKKAAGTCPNLAVCVCVS
jgi:hypothetical protein